jgi:hypothetical protein
MRSPIVLPVTCLLLASVVAPADAAVKVQPAEIVETRMVTLIKKPNVFSSDAPRLQLKLNVDGPELKGSTKWGRIKIAEAVDDVGTDLKPKDDAMGFGPRGDDLEDISRFGFDDEEKKKTGTFDATIGLTLPPRKATAIKSLKGEFQVLAGGEEKVVTLTKLKSMQGKPLADPALKAAGITGTVAKASGDDPALAIDYKGSTDAIKEVEILDASGKSVSSGRFSSGFGDQQTVNYMLNKPLDDAMTMKIHLIVGQKAVTVPFELKDVKLP